jgi:hypothetical protein
VPYGASCSFDGGMSLKELLLTAIGLQLGIAVALIVLVGRVRERVTKLEEWVRLEERRENGEGS